MACSSDLKCPTGYRCGQAGGSIETSVPVPEVIACADGMATSCGGICRVPPGRDEIDLGSASMLMSKSLVIVLVPAAPHQTVQMVSPARKSVRQVIRLSRYLYPFCWGDLSSVDQGVEQCSLRLALSMMKTTRLIDVPASVKTQQIAHPL